MDAFAPSIGFPAMPRLLGFLRSRAGSVGLLKLAALMLAGGLGLLGLATLPAGAPVAPAAPLPPPPSDTTFFYGPVPDSASPTGRVHVDTIPIAVAAGTQYWIELTNGAPDGTHRVDSAKVRWNGRQFVGASDFTSLIESQEKVLAAVQKDTLRVQLWGPTTAYATVRVYGIPDPTFTVYGDTTFTKSNGSTQTWMRTFTTPADAKKRFYLFLANGDSLGANRVGTARVKVNGTIRMSNTSITSAVGSAVAFFDTLPAGTTELEVQLTGPSGTFVRVRLAASDSTAPTVAVTSPAESAWTTLTNLPVTGTLSDRTALAVTVNGGAAVVSGNNTSFADTVALTTDGPHTLTVVATDAADNQTTVIRTVRRDTQAPSLSVTAPASGTSYTQAESTTVTGTVSDGGKLADVTVNVLPAVVTGGAFSENVTLTYGSTTVTTLATASAGNVTTDVRTVVRDTLAPALVITSPADGSSTTADSVSVTGTASDANPFALTVNGTATTVSGGSYSRTVALALGSNTLTVVAIDAAGNTQTLTRSVTRTSPLPPEPSTVAPTLSPTVATTVKAATEFLYSGSAPIQTGVAPGTINELRAAVIRGKVLDSVGQPLSGVAVSILGHAEYGQTLSRANGWFDLAVNGGSRLTVNFSKAGWLAAQRVVDIAWQDYTVLDSVAMVSSGPIVGTVDFSQPIQVVQAPTVSDSAGSRQATLMFRQGTVVTAVLANGTTQALSGTQAVRVQEFTVGPLGPARMPAALPPTSAYTYAVGLNIDSALQLGTTKVTFSKPVSYYVDNFLGFPVGDVVPVGSYDVQTGQWIPQADGRVVKIVSITNGLADVAIDSTSSPASPAQLAVLGIDSTERASLASTYGVGKTLWRVAMDHFSVYDLNWAEIILGLIAPNGGSVSAGLALLQKCHLAGFSTIGCEGQTLGEAIPLTGTPFALHYESDRVPGYASEFGIDIPLRGDSIPPSVVGLYVEVEIAGRRIDSVFPVNRTRAKVVWDGKDAYNRPMQGRQPYKVGVGFIYQTTMLSAGGGSGGGSSFGGYFPVGRGIVGRRRPIILVEWRGTLGPWNALAFGLGGWTLSAHHAYDPNGQTLHLGTGGRRETVTIGATLDQVAGNGTTGSTGDGGPAESAQLANPSDVAVGADGTIFIADLSNHRIRKVSPAGIISTYAGTGTSGSSGDGGPATAAKLQAPEAIALAPDGSLFIAEGSTRIRRVDPAGGISLFAGSNSSGFAGDGGPATAALFNLITDIALGPDGSLYVADNGNRRVRRIMPDGKIYTIAGNGAGGFGGNDSLATKANLNDITGIDVGPDGTLYISSGYEEIRKVGTDGIIRRFAGTDPNTGLSYPDDGRIATLTALKAPKRVSVGPDGTVYIAEVQEAANTKRGMRIVRVVEATNLVSTVAGNGVRACGKVGSGSCKQGDDGDGGLAGRGYLCGPAGMAFAPNGDLVFAEPNGDQVRRITAAQPGVSLGNMLVADEGGGVVYEFNQAGQHLRTREAFTGDTLLTFGYDTLGLLVTVADKHGNVTTIQRGPQGQPLKIIAPFGQQTTLGTDPNLGFLTSVANPGGETTRLWYRANGLLDSLSNPRSKVSRFTYDSLGLLTRDDGPGGGYITLTRTPAVNPKTNADTGFTVTTTTAMGRTSSYAYAFLPSRLTVRTSTNAAGHKTVNLVEPGVTTRPDSTVITVAQGGDRRWGMQVPTVDSLITKLPSGLTSRFFERRTDSLANPSDPFSLATHTRRLVSNADTATVVYTAANRRTVQTSAEGRQAFTRFDLQGRVVASQVAGLDSVRYTYDTRGRLDSVIDGGRKTKYTYSGTSGLLANVTDPLGRSTQFSYDSAGRVTMQTLPDGRVIAFSYDSAGNLTTLTPPGRPAHGFQYSSAGLATQYDPPGIPGPKPTRYFYNRDRQVDSIVRPDSLKIGFGYDGAGRPSTLSFDRGTLAFGYSPTSGSLTSMASPGGDSLKFTYDGALPKTVTWKGTVNGSVGVSYDTHFRVTGQTVNGANSVNFAYDKDGLLKQAGALGLRRSGTNGLLLADSLNTVKTTYGYTTRGELSAMHAARGGTALLGTGYVRDSLGRIVQLFDTTLGTAKRWSYVYDQAGRLTADSLNGSLFHAFTYDSNGNRLSYLSGAGTVTYRYDAQDRLLASYANGDSTTYTYGSNGELKTKTVPGGATTTYTYDALGNLMRVLVPNGSAVDTIGYVIDGQNRRVGRTLNGTVTHRWLYQNQLNPVAELDGAGNVVSRFVYGTRSNVPDYMLKGGNVYRLVTDHLGSVRLVVDTATGAVAQQLDYDEWGVASVVGGTGLQTIGFAGGLQDIVTGLVRFGARDYDPAISAWTSADPMGFQAGSSNLRSYASHDPVNHLDPTGLWMKAVGLTGVLSAAGFENWTVEVGIVGDGWDFSSWDVGLIFQSTTGAAFSPGMGAAGGVSGMTGHGVVSFTQIEGYSGTLGMNINLPGGKFAGAELGNIPLPVLQQLANGNMAPLDQFRRLGPLIIGFSAGQSVSALPGWRFEPYAGLTFTGVLSLKDIEPWFTRLVCGAVM